MTENDKANSSVRQEKRSKFDQSEKPSSGSRPLLALTAVGLLLAVVALYVIWSKNNRSVNAAYSTTNSGAGRDVRIPVSELGDGRARFYTYALADGKQIKFFAAQSPDGTFRAAFDACDVCFEARLGYTQQGDEMLCNQCGRTFPLAKVNTESGGCNPAPLKRTVEGDQLVIRAADLEKGARYF